MKIQNLIEKLSKELDDGIITEQRKRYLMSYKFELMQYINNHPEAINIPNSFELYCNLNPHAPECLTYDV
jgi:Zn-finger domain-containing protein